MADRKMTSPTTFAPAGPRIPEETNSRGLILGLSRET